MSEIRRVTQELRTIEKHLVEITSVRPSDANVSTTLDPLLDAEVIKEFKAAVDTMRQLLWSYLESAYKTNGTNLHIAMHTFRMQRVTEMLRVLEEPFRSPWSAAELAKTPEGYSFLSKVNEIAELAYERHFEEQRQRSTASNGSAD